MKINIYSDGSSLNSKPDEPSGYGYTIFVDESPYMYGGGFLNPPTSNNRAEITAVLVPLATVYKKFAPSSVTVYSDSQYVLRGISEWLDGWVHHGDLNSGRIKNPDLWKLIHFYSSRMRVKTKWVRGHSGNAHNEVVDDMAGYFRINRTIANITSKDEVQKMLGFYASSEGKKANSRAVYKTLDYLLGKA